MWQIELIDQVTCTSSDLLKLGLYRLPRQQFPRLRALASALARYDGERELDEGMDIVLGGLRAQLANARE